MNCMRKQAWPLDMLCLIRIPVEEKAAPNDIILHRNESYCTQLHSFFPIAQKFMPNYLTEPSSYANTPYKFHRATNC